ncbi:hypothetical protein Anas_01762 [Armadillidium nasatum]|uniref:Uncharacterized protein n=1 Tax=Armadillidium nasatum TaxID=96803 RepID=A0A5N5T181_9CRUS|nr:hypothetical protein Anas_01762 [Armadillidium nasatum]
MRARIFKRCSSCDKAMISSGIVCSLQQYPLSWRSLQQYPWELYVHRTVFIGIVCPLRNIQTIWYAHCNNIQWHSLYVHCNKIHRSVFFTTLSIGIVCSSQQYPSPLYVHPNNIQLHTMFITTISINIIVLCFLLLVLQDQCASQRAQIHPRYFPWDSNFKQSRDSFSRTGGTGIPSRVPYDPTGHGDPQFNYYYV